MVRGSVSNGARREKGPSTNKETNKRIEKACQDRFLPGDKTARQEVIGAKDSQIQRARGIRVQRWIGATTPTRKPVLLMTQLLGAFLRRQEQRARRNSRLKEPPRSTRATLRLPGPDCPGNAGKEGHPRMVKRIHEYRQAGFIRLFVLFHSWTARSRGPTNAGSRESGQLKSPWGMAQSAGKRIPGREAVKECRR